MSVAIYVMNRTHIRRRNFKSQRTYMYLLFQCNISFDLNKLVAVERNINKIFVYGLACVDKTVGFNNSLQQRQIGLGFCFSSGLKHTQKSILLQPKYSCLLWLTVLHKVENSFNYFEYIRSTLLRSLQSNTVQLRLTQM